MAKMSSYLNFNGNTEEAINFYQSILGGKIELMRWKDMPEGNNLPADEQNKIMHICLQVDDNNAIMATDSLESMGQKTVFGNNHYIILEPVSKEEADKIYKGLSEGGKIEMALEDTFWGAYYGAFADKFGMQWMINYTYPQSEKKNPGEFKEATV